MAMFLVSRVLGAEVDELLVQGNVCYEAGRKEEAKELYQKAADLGSVEGHFRLAYQYVLPRNESIAHYVAAARKGHEEALGYVLEELLFRGESLRNTDPAEAMAVYKAAKKVNPDIQLYNEAMKVKIMTFCLKAPDFDSVEFLSKYGVEDDDDEYPFYDVWELAEEASRGGRFGTPDPGLVFNLVIRGGNVPAEFEYAIEDVYSNYVNGVVREFNISKYVTSGIGVSHCAMRSNERVEKKRVLLVQQLADNQPEINPSCFQLAYDASVRFIEIKARWEEGHGGSGRGAWILNSEMDQKADFLSTLESFQGGLVPVSSEGIQQLDKQLIEITRRVIILLGEEEEPDPILPTVMQIEILDLQWKSMVDAVTHLLLQINPEVDEEVWKCWLTTQRIGQLDSVIQRIID